jgi:hypothetical protein
MLEINDYHDHIVNLQGITAGWNFIERQLSEVKRMGSVSVRILVINPVLSL